ncbi:MAG: DNA repair protein RecN [Coriobacteriia bacterium]|nr:DNA repair protein RecN [Coriobacteriia bacterium]
MLRDLHIQNLALIDDVWLEFGPGLTVLTGETGAGKTVLLSALELIMGGRGDSGQIAAGADRAKVEAAFDLDSGSLPEELTVSRTMSTGGRTRVLLNGDLSSVSALQKQVGSLIDLHGQHDHQALLSSSRHIEYLDRWASGDILPLIQAYTAARKEWQQAQHELQEIEDMLARSLEERDAGSIALAEIERIDPQPGEDDELRERLPALQNSERIAELMQQAQESLRGDQAALEQLYDFDVALEQVATFDSSVHELRREASEARQVLDGIADAVSEYAAEIQHDSRVLEKAFDRLSELESLAKRYGPTLDAVIERRERLASLIDVAENSDERLFEARDAEKLARKTLTDTAQALASERKVAAKAFIRQLSDAASDLELGKVRFDLDFKELPFEQWTTNGSEKVEILYAPAPTVPTRPLTKIASGGEISRVMLALKSVLGGADNTGILIFDEVDAGIGGATGLAIGAKLKDLAKTHQVIVVTHLAQVAAYADAHFKVSKELKGDKVNTTVTPLQNDEQTQEIARMLSGSDSETALSHASELLKSAKTYS